MECLEKYENANGAIRITIIVRKIVRFLYLVWTSKLPWTDGGSNYFEFALTIWRYYRRDYVH